MVYRAPASPDLSCAAGKGDEPLTSEPIFGDDPVSEMIWLDIAARPPICAPVNGLYSHPSIESSTS
jgi:hypothetical protein